jgi:hypothetical protein
MFVCEWAGRVCAQRYVCCANLPQMHTLPVCTELFSMGRVPVLNAVGEACILSYVCACPSITALASVPAQPVSAEIDFILSGCAGFPGKPSRVVEYLSLLVTSEARFSPIGDRLCTGWSVSCHSGQWLWEDWMCRAQAVTGLSVPQTQCDVVGNVGAQRAVKGHLC